MRLTDRQRAAVDARPGAVFISAAAGSGKTRVLTERFARLVREVDAGPTAPDLMRIAAVTFTEKAAGEIAERIRGALARDGDVDLARDVERAWIGTIHGLCARILRRHAFEAGIDPSFATADEVLSGMLREQAFAESARGLIARSEPARRLVADYDIARLAEDVQAAEEYLRSLALPVEALEPPERDAEEFERAYHEGFAELIGEYSAHYQMLKDELGVLDFEDLQLRTLRLLETHPRIADAYRSQFAEVMVDEFQDTNQLQVSVVQALSGGKMATVGDDKQSIYGWRNADVEVFRRRAADVSAERSFTLPENFRSHPELVTFYNVLFAGEPFWPGDFLELEAGAGDSGDAAGAWPEGEPRVRLTLLDDGACKDAESPDAEAIAVATRLAALRQAGVPQHDMVVLLRAMSRAERFADVLRDAGLDVFIASGGTYFETREAEELRSLLEVVANSGNDEAFARLLTGYSANVSDDALLALRRAASGTTLFGAAADPGRAPLPESDEAAVRRLVDAVEYARTNQGRLSLYELVHCLVEALDLDLALLAAGYDGGWANLLKYARLAEEFESAAPGDPAALLEYLDARMRHARYEQQAATAAENVDAVRIMSIHAAKGLEFPVVALAELGKQTRNDTRDFKVGLLGGRPTLGVRLPVVEGVDEKARVTPALELVNAWQRERDIAEAKRLFYVAVTRASRGLLLFGRVTVGGKPQERAADWLATGLDLDLAGLAAAGGHSEVTLGGARVVVELQGAPESCRMRVAAPVEPVSLGAFQQAEDASAYGDARPPERVSYTALERHRTCGYHYYVRDVLRLAQLRDQSKPGDARSIGVVVHEALRSVDSAHAPDGDRVRALAARAGLTPAEAARVAAAVTGFAEMPVAREAYRGERVGHEVPFALKVGGAILEGSIDLLSLNGSEALVVDYKTGTHEITDEHRARWRRQAECYALAVLESGAQEVRVVFVQPETGSAEEFTFSRKDAPAIGAGIASAIARIANGEFKPLGTFAPQVCPHCAGLGSLCPVTAPRRRGGAA